MDQTYTDYLETKLSAVCTALRNQMDELDQRQVEDSIDFLEIAAAYKVINAVVDAMKIVDRNEPEVVDD